MSDAVRDRAVLWPKGNHFEDFHVGQKFAHHWGRTISEADTLLFTTLTLSYNPIYFNRDYAIAHGHRDIVVNPQLLFNVVLGLSVEDCSEAGGPFLGVFDLTYHRPVYPGITVRSFSETVEARRSSSNPANGIITWQTRGLDSDDQLLVSFRRSNIVRRRGGGSGEHQ